MSDQESPDKKFDVLAIGNAIVDILVKTDDKFLESIGLQKGSMSLIDEEKANKLFNLFTSVEKSSSSSINEMSGGCAANVVAGISSFEGKASFIGKISNDESGNRFAEKLKERGIEFSTAPVTEGHGTGRSLIIVTEDGARTMCTYLGCSQEMSDKDINEELIAQSKTIFLTGFMWDNEKGKEAAIKTIEIAQKNDCKIAFTLSDSLCVERHRQEFIDLIDNIDILFANEQEINALFETDNHEDSIKKMAEKYAGKEKIAALADSSGSVTIVSKDDPVKVPAEKVDQVIDTTGSGSLFVSGFLYAYTHGFNLEQSAKLGNLSAAECMGHLGARPLIKLKDLVAKI